MHTTDINDLDRVLEHYIERPDIVDKILSHLSNVLKNRCNIPKNRTCLMAGDERIVTVDFEPFGDSSTGANPYITFILPLTEKTIQI